MLPRLALAGSFVDQVISFHPGLNAGFGQSALPGVVLGPPKGGGLIQGSADVVSLGTGGEIVVSFNGGICDGSGPDFTVFENAFHAGSPDGEVFIEAGIVAVSSDGMTFSQFPYDAKTFAGLAGVTPVLSNPDNGIDPFNPAASGGDSFDLATLGLARADYLRITDPGDAIPDPGNSIPGGSSRGFDFDAVAILHPCSIEIATPTTTPDAMATVSDTPATPVFTATPTSTATATATRTPLPGDANGDGEVDEEDGVQTIGEIFDGDGDRVEEVGGGSVVSVAAVDANYDSVVTAADLIALVRQVTLPR